MRGRAFRHGNVVCELIAVNRYDDDRRIGLAPAERQHATIRFLEPPAGSLEHDLDALVRSRGAAARRAAERLEPLELVLDAPGGAAARRGPAGAAGGAVRCAAGDRVRHPGVVVTRLAPEEIKALKFAGHRQLARWSRKIALTPRQHSQRTALISAVQKLDHDAFAHGVEPRAPEPG